MTIEFVRTPDSRFENLPGYGFAPQYAQVRGGLRMHYLDEGPRDGVVVLLLHGEPSWSYLYRKMIPGLAAAGLRVVAPDLIGFGRSDKPTDRAAYSYQSHMDWLTELLFQRLDLNDITLFCQDWGGLLGLRAVGEHPDRFQRVIAANTFLPTGDLPPTPDFLKWRDFSQKIKQLPVGKIIANSCVNKPAPEIIAAYEAPFPDESFKAGARQFPMLVPVTPDDPASEANRRAWGGLRAWTKPFLTLFSDSDPITRGGDIFFRRYIPGTKNQPHTTIKGAGHFLQEDKGEEIAALIVEFLRATP